MTSTGSGTLYNSGLILGPLFALLPGLIVFLLCTALPKPGWNFLISMIYSALSLALCGLQLVSYRYFGFFHSFPSGFSKDLPNAAGSCIPQLLMMSIPLFVLLFIGKKLFSFKPIRRLRAHLLTILLCFAVQLGVVALLPAFGSSGDTSAYGLYHHASDAYYSVNKLGAFTALRLDLMREVRDTKADGSITLESTPAPETEPPVTLQPLISEMITDSTEPVENVLDINLAALAQSERNDDIAEVHSYFANRTPSHTNNKTELFAGRNLIIISVDRFDVRSIEESHFPTLQRLRKEGILFSNFYAPNWGASGTESEYALLTGLIPKGGTQSLPTSASSQMPLTISQQLIHSGYWAYAYCSNLQGQEAFLENLGYEYHHYDAGIDLIDRSTKDYVNYTPFTVYYSTTSHSLDESLELLLERLTAAGQLQNTVIVLVGLSGQNASEDLDACRTNCIIWSDHMTPEIRNEPNSILDLLPTLSNLFGLAFDSRLYMGRDMFGDATPLVIFPDRSWITDQATCNVSSGVYATQGEIPCDDDYVNSISTEVDNRFTVSGRILDFNYWKLLFE